MTNDFIRYQLTFDYEFIDIVEYTLKDCNIIHKSFAKQTSFIVDIPCSLNEYLLSELYITTLKQIKIYNLVSNILDDDHIEGGTDKPLGSKDAIDEN